MLTIAPSAADAITKLVESNGLPDTAGVRLAPRPDEPGRPQLRIELSQAPDPGDQVVDEAGAHVFVDSALTAALDDRTLEATAEQERVTFSLGEQAA